MEGDPKDEQQELPAQEELLAALERNDVEAFRALLRSGRVDPRHRYGKPHFSTCLEIAARRPYGKDFVRELLQVVKPNVNFIVPEPVHHAAKRGHSEVLAALLCDKRTKANAHDSEGRTALHYACMHVTQPNARGYESCVKLLMGRFSPADINRTDAHGFSAVHAAARYKPRKQSTKEGVGDDEPSPAQSPASDEETWQARMQLIKVILDLGRDVLDIDSVRALGRTAREDLLHRFPDLERHLPAGADALRADPHSALATALRDGRIGVFKALLRETDADGNPVLDANHWFGAPLHATCLEMACKKREATPFVEALLAAGADPNIANKLDEKFPIHVACEKGHHKQLKALFSGSNATDPNARDKLGNTALHYIVEKWGAVTNEKRICLDFLLERENVDVNRKNNRGFTVLMLAVEYNVKYAIRSILVTMHDSLDLTVQFRDKELRDIITDLYPELTNDVSRSEGSQLRDNENEWFDLLQKTREAEFVEQLRRSTTLPDLSMNDKKNTLLQRAARYGMENAVKILLEKGANANQTFKGNFSPPGVLATYYRHKGVMDIFINHPEFDVNAYDAKGNTALHYAARDGRDMDIVIKLLRRGADMKIPNKLGKPPLGKDQVQSLLDQCVDTNGKNAIDEDYELILDYRLLAPGREEKRSSVSDTVQYQSVPGDDNQICVERGPESEDLESEMYFLHMMSKDDDVSSLLDHPVAHSFLELKWSRVRPIAYFNFGVYVAFVVALNMFIINSKSLIAQPTIPQTNITEELNNTRVDDNKTYNFISFSVLLAWFSLVVSAFLWLTLCFREAVQFTFDQRKYIGSVENYLDWTILLFSLVALGMPLLQPENALLSTINVVTIMLSCAELLVLLGRLSHFAKYVQMLKVVLTGYFLPLVSYCIIIIAFGLSFHTLFHESQGVGNTTEYEYTLTEDDDTKYFNIWYMSIVKSLVMMTGELEFSSYPDSSVLSIILFVLFVLLVTVVLFNLLIGLAVNDTKNIEAMAQQLRLKTRVELVLFTESILVNMHNSKWRVLRKLSSMLLQEKLQGAILFPWVKLEDRKAWVKPNQRPELVLANGEGSGTRRQVPRELLDRATQIISRRSGEEAKRAAAVSLSDVNDKLERVLNLLAGRSAAEGRAQMRLEAVAASVGASVADAAADGAADGAADAASSSDARLNSVFTSESDDC